MNAGLNFDVYENGRLYKQFRDAGCYGSYIKTDYFCENYRNHKVELFIVPDAIERVSGVYKVNKQDSNILNKKLSVEEQLQYLSLFKGLMFDYDFELVKSNVRDAYSKILNQDLPRSAEDIAYNYVKVTLDLSQFSSIVSAKNALFLIRNGQYSHNATSARILLYLNSLFPKFDKLLLFQFGEYLDFCKMIGRENYSNGEYKFFSRGYGNLSLKPESSGLVGMKILQPFTFESYWEKYTKKKGKSVDEVTNTAYIVKNVELKSILGDYMLLKVIELAYNKKYSLSERDMKLLKNKLLLFCSGFLYKSANYLKFKALLNEDN